MCTLMLMRMRMLNSCHDCSDIHDSYAFLPFFQAMDLATYINEFENIARTGSAAQLRHYFIISKKLHISHEMIHGSMCRPTRRGVYPTQCLTQCPYSRGLFIDPCDPMLRPIPAFTSRCSSSPCNRLQCTSPSVTCGGFLVVLIGTCGPI